MAEKEINTEAVENADGIAYDRILPDMPTVNVFAGCVVHVRPYRDWKGENFGFDWMRRDDSHIKGDIKYAENMGKLWISRGGNRIPQDNMNSMDGSFQKDATMFRNLERTHFPNPTEIEWLRENTTGMNDLDRIKKEVKFMYHVPIMTLRKGNSAKLNLIVHYDPDTTKALPKKIKVLSSDPTKLKPDKDEPITISEDRKKGEFELNITCTDTFFRDQCIALVAVYDETDGTEKEEYCGFLRVLANHKIHKLKVAFINVNFIDSSGSEVKGLIQSTDLIEIRKILNQAMIDLETETITCNIANTTHLTHRIPNEAKAIAGESPDYDEKKTLNYANVNLNRAYDTSTSKFKQDANVIGALFADDSGVFQKEELMGKYKYHIPIAVLGAPSAGAAGTTHPNVTKVRLDKTGGEYTTLTCPIILFEGRTVQTAVHEILHAMGLLHSFSSDQSYTYKHQKTENIMDYSHTATIPITRINTWEWQWRIMRSYLSNLYPVMSTAEFEARIANIAIP